MTTTAKERYEVVNRLHRAGVSFDDARALRRISLTLRRWFELECNGEVRRDETTTVPYYHYDRNTPGPFLTVRCADREQGAYKRLALIMARYPSLIHYVQTDPRGCALYLLTTEQLGSDDIARVYNRGITIY